MMPESSDRSFNMTFARPGSSQNDSPAIKFSISPSRSCFAGRSKILLQLVQLFIIAFNRLFYIHCHVASLTH